MSNNPNYTDNSRGRKIATKCRVCGGSLLTPQDMKIEAHEECVNNYKTKMRMMW